MGRVRLRRTRPRPRARRVGLTCAAFVIFSASGCLNSRSRAERIELEQNPLRDARAGEVCHYRSLRDGEPDAPPVAEEWTLAVRQVVGGAAKVEVELLGSKRNPPSSSPREPGWSVFLQTKEEAFSGSQILRLLRRPDLSPRGARAWLEREVSNVSGSVKERPVLVQGKTCAGHEITISFTDKDLERASYRLVIVDDLPGIGLFEAELEEVWLSDAPDGELHEERRRDRLSLVDWRK